MSIQISVVIWAIISFAVLALALNKILFKPLLALMDARNAKIAASKKRLTDAQERQEEALRLVREERTAAARERRRQITDSLEAVHSRRLTAFDEKRREHALYMEQRHGTLLQESREILSRMEGSTDAIAAELADRLADTFTDDALAERENERRAQAARGRSRLQAEKQAAMERINRRGRAAAELEQLLRETEWTAAEIRSEYARLTDEQLTAVEQGVLDAEQKLDTELDILAETVAEELLD